VWPTLHHKLQSGRTCKLMYWWQFSLSEGYALICRLVPHPLLNEATFYAYSHHKRIKQPIVVRFLAFSSDFVPLFVFIMLWGLQTSFQGPCVIEKERKKRERELAAMSFLVPFILCASQMQQMTSRVEIARSQLQFLSSQIMLSVAHVILKATNTVLGS